MTLFAANSEIGLEGWLAIIGAIFVGLGNLAGVLYAIYRGHKTEMKLEAVGEKVEIVHKATNSIVSQLVAATDKAGQQKGAQDERERADARDHPGQPPTPGIHQKIDEVKVKVEEVKDVADDIKEAVDPPKKEKS